jgi:hypothetical protein
VVHVAHKVRQILIDSANVRAAALVRLDERGKEEFGSVGIIVPNLHIGKDTWPAAESQIMKTT